MSFIDFEGSSDSYGTLIFVAVYAKGPKDCKDCEEDVIVKIEDDGQFDEEEAADVGPNHVIGQSQNGIRFGAADKLQGAAVFVLVVSAPAVTLQRELVG